MLLLIALDLEGGRSTGARSWLQETGRREPGLQGSLPAGECGVDPKRSNSKGGGARD